MNIPEVYKEADETFTELIQLLTAVPPEEFNVIPFEGSWTIGQVTQHIILSAGGFVQLLNGAVKDTDRDPEQNVANLRATFLNYDIKMKSPEFILPQEKNYDKDKQLAKLADIKVGFLKAIETGDMSKTCISFEIPGAGYITRAEAVHFTNVHTMRHVHQLKNILARLKKASH